MNVYLTNWVSDFLKDRSYLVSINEKMSPYYLIKSGVPHGSCLSPALFNLYSSDLSQCIPAYTNHSLFADDLCVCSSNKLLKFLQKVLQETINNVSAFCKNWGLALTKSKTVYTVFTTAGYHASYERINKLKLTICNQLIPIDPYPKFLGIHLDPKLSFTHHFDFLSKRVNSKINLLKTIKSLGWHQNNKICLTIQTIYKEDYKQTIYKTLIRSLFDYSFIAL